MPMVERRQQLYVGREQRPVSTTVACPSGARSRTRSQTASISSDSRSPTLTAISPIALLFSRNPAHSAYPVRLRTRSPLGSNRGSAATSPRTQRPKMSTSIAAPTSSSTGR